jgi:hypothetical protein
MRRLTMTAKAAFFDAPIGDAERPLIFREALDPR